MRGHTGGVFICEGVHKEGHLSVRGHTGEVFICEGVHRRGISL